MYVPKYAIISIMRSANRMLVISVAFVCAGVLIVLGTLFLSSQKAPQYPPEKKFLATTVPPTLTPTLAPGQIKAIYTFYIQASPHNAWRRVLGLTQTDTGKVFTVNIGTFISLDFGPGKFYVSLSSPQDIFKCVGSGCLPHSSPMNSIFSSWVTRAGFATIQVIEAK